MTADLSWTEPLALDVRFGYLADSVGSPRQQHPQVVLNGPGESVLRILREELSKCEGFLFSVAFVTPRALALLKQELVDFTGTGRIVTSDYLAFNSPASFAELMNLEQLVLSGVWMLYSFILVVLGFLKRMRILRIMAILLFGVTILKIFFYDLHDLELLYRIYSFMGLGVVLLVVSFLYQKYRHLIL